MYTLTHAAIGFILCYLLFKDKRLALIGLLFGAIPDLDGLFIFFNYSMHLQIHRTLLHPFIWGPIFVIPVVLLFKRYFKISHIIVAGVLSYSMHIICDLFFTKSPIPILWPISNFSIAIPIFKPMIMITEFLVIAIFITLIIHNFEYYAKLTRFYKKVYK